MRKAYLDHVRWVTVIVVLAYHVGYLFNGVGVIGGVPGAESLPAFDAALYVVYPWFMVLLFTAAGMSARYSLQKRTIKKFLKERTVKLLVPCTLGLFVIHWVTGYLNIKMGGGLEYIPSFLVYPISVLSGIGPLWFIQMLFLFSCVLALLKKLDPADRVWNACKKANLAVIILLFVVLWGASQILNAPVLTMYRFGIYFAAYLIGYYILSHEEAQDTVEKACLPMLAAAVTGAAAYTIYYYYHGISYAAPECLQSIWTNLYLWIAVLAILGCFKRYFNRETANYMASASFGLYVLHYPVVLTACYLLHEYCRLPALWNYLIALAAEMAVTFALYEAVRRIPVLRFLVLGLRKKKCSGKNHSVK